MTSQIVSNPVVNEEFNGSWQGEGSFSFQKRETNIITEMFCKANVINFSNKWFRPSYNVGLLSFAFPLNLEKLRVHVSTHLLKFPRFCSQPLYENNKIFLKELSPYVINMEDHAVEQDSVGWKDSDVNNFINKICIEQADPPLWKFYILNYLHNGLHYIVIQIDHAIGDGVSIIKAVFSLFDHDQDPSPSLLPIPPSSTNHSKNNPQGSSTSRRWMSLQEGFRMVGSVLDAFIQPLRPGDSSNSLLLKDYRHPSPEKTFLFTKDIPLQRFREIQARLGGNVTIHDICIAVLTMALRRYFEEVNDPVLKSLRKSISCSFPIDRRRREISSASHPMSSAKLPSSESESKGPAGMQFGNRVTVGSVSLDVMAPSRLETLWKTKSRLDRVKKSPKPFIQIRLMESVFPLLSMSQWIRCFHYFNSKFTLMVSNVPGPPREVRILGQPVQTMRFVSSLPIGVFCGIFSYNGSLSLSLSGDTSLGANLELFANKWNEEFDAFHLEVQSLNNITNSSVNAPLSQSENATEKRILTP